MAPKDPIRPSEGLDREEEELKARNEKLLAQIAEFNRRIKELGKGFGFFSSLFKMRKLQKERKILDQEQADIAARIDNLRKANASASGWISSPRPLRCRPRSNTWRHPGPA